MFTRKSGYVIPLLFVGFLTLLLNASNASLANAAGLSLAANGVSQFQNASPSVTTQCPAPGKGRAAILPPLTLGKDQNIVYVSFQGSPVSSTLKRYDAVSKTTKNIITLKNKNLSFTQISGNGQWILFVSEQTINGTPTFQLQLVRMDGKFLQTLYCSTEKHGIEEVQWSTDLKLIVFEIISNGTEKVDVLNTANGSVRTDYSTPTSSFVFVRTWLDLHRVYLTNTQIDQPPNIIYLLDTNNPGKLQTVFHGTFNDFDSSFNGRFLFTNSCRCDMGGNSGPSSIVVQPGAGGQQHALYSSRTDAITNVRAVLPKTLLFTVGNLLFLGGGNTAHNGLWKINTDGTGVTRLTTDKTGQSSFFNSSSQFPWSNVSRNGNLYGLEVIGTKGGLTFTLEVGPISGGSPRAFASVSGFQITLTIAGWTTM
jgi:eukaryotic-like serine/threonine-protein kinase